MSPGAARFTAVWMFKNGDVSVPGLESLPVVATKIVRAEINPVKHNNDSARMKILFMILNLFIGY